MLTTTDAQRADAEQDDQLGHVIRLPGTGDGDELRDRMRHHAPSVTCCGRRLLDDLAADVWKRAVSHPRDSPDTNRLYVRIVVAQRAAGTRSDEMQTMALGLDHRGADRRANGSHRDRQKFFVTFLAGKLIGLALFFLLITQLAPWLIGHIAGAANVSQVDADALQSSLTSTINGVNTAWTLAAAFLVFFMQAGFMMLEAGFARTVR